MPGSQVSIMLDMKFLGPPLEAGPLPAVFYFTLSAEHSLHMDPFNQPTLFLQSSQLRIFSVTLPGHASPSSEVEALRFWATEMRRGVDVIGNFVGELLDEVEKMVAKQVLISKKLVVMGVSRGALIALHLAARTPHIPFILGFAPLTRLSQVKDFVVLQSEQWDVIHLVEKLYDRTLRFYIGNHDTRVGNAACFELISSLAQTAYEHRILSSPIELIVGPSIGREGHGTSRDVFFQGSEWIKSKLIEI